MSEYQRCPEPHRGVRRWVRNLLALGALSAATAPAAMQVFPAETECGPHRCEVAVTLDPYAEVNFGGFGSGRLPLQKTSGLPLGIEIDLGEVPTQGATSERLPDILDVDTNPDEETLRQLAQLYTGAEDSTQRVKDDVVKQLGLLTLGSAAFYGALFTVIGPQRRQELTDRMRQRKTWAVPLSMALILNIAPFSPQEQGASSGWDTTHDLFVNTPLEGLETKGAYLRYAVMGIRELIDYRADYDRYYERAAESAVDVIEADREFMAISERHQDPTIVIRTSDEHCNMGMNTVFTRGAKAAGATIWVTTGDVAIGGTPIDKICVEQMAKNMPELRIVAPGNHDGSELRGVFAANGFIVVDGTIQEVGGLRFVGMPDPNYSIFGETVRYNGRISHQTGVELLGAACAAEQPLIALGHANGSIRPIIDGGCATYGFSGHTHKESTLLLPRQDGRGGLIFTAGTSGGVKDGAISVNKLRAPAVFYFDVYTHDGELQEVWRVIISPDQTAKLEQVPFEKPCVSELSAAC